MAGTVLITGGAGFIGTHLARRLQASGRAVRIFDDFNPQVHGEAPDPWLATGDGADVVIGDVRDAKRLREALDGVTAVVHLAARVGVGQSMYRLSDYVSGNDLGTAVLLEALMRHPVERLVVASSMSIYGEGLYRAADGRIIEDAVRGGDIADGRWDPVDADASALVPLPTPENKRPQLASVYALNKFVQERLSLTVGAAHGIPTVALRLFNVYGPGQALSNPYTGVIANFAVRLLHGKPPLLFEDGLQRRDFVHVEDVARALELSLTAPAAVGRAINIGSGRAHTIRDVATMLAKALGRTIAPVATRQLRAGDIRHCFADPGLAADLLGFRADIPLGEGLRRLAPWLEGQTPIDRVEEARAELGAWRLAR